MSYPDDTQALMRKFEPILKDLTYHQLRVLNHMVVERIRLVQKAGALMHMSQFHVGDRVSWDGSDGMIRTGIIIRLNQKTVSVKTGGEGHWNVPPHMLRKEE